MNRRIENTGKRRKKVENGSSSPEIAIHICRLPRDITSDAYRLLSKPVLSLLRSSFLPEKNTHYILRGNSHISFASYACV